MKLVIASGYFNPLHVGHIRYLTEASGFGHLIVIVNNDEQVALKGSVPFMPLRERLEIVGALRCVTAVVPSIDTDRSVRETLKGLMATYPFAEFVFAKGGDSTPENTPEKELVEVVYGVGGTDKPQSSSSLIKRAVGITGLTPSTKEVG